MRMRKIGLQGGSDSLCEGGYNLFNFQGTKRRNKVHVELVELSKLTAQSCFMLGVCCNAVKRISISIEHMSSKCEDGLLGVKMVLQGLFVRERDCWDLGRTNSPTSARHRDGLGFIRI